MKKHTLQIMASNLICLLAFLLVAQISFAKDVSDPQVGLKDADENRSPMVQYTPGTIALQKSGVDEQITALKKYLDSYPPQVESQDESIKLHEKLNKVIDTLESRLKDNADDPQIELRLGECYRLGHNLDIVGSWDKSEKHLKRAISLKPDFVDAYLTLGSLYINTGFKYAPSAEKAFSEVIDISSADSKQLAAAHSGLVFAYYYQGRLEDALWEVDKALALIPNDPEATRLKETLLAVKNRQ